MAITRSLVRLVCISCLLATCATTAFAQTGVRVTRDRSSIWRHDFQSPAAIVDAGTMLIVVGRRADWYEVVVPGEERATGFILKGYVEAPPGAEPEPSSARPVGLFGFGQFGYSWFAARNSFEAVLGQAGGSFLGGGGELRIGGFFLNGSVERFTKTGERVFVVNREVFKLGTRDTITMRPMALTAGWRFTHEHVTPYLGAGTGRLFYKEAPSSADADEIVDTRFTSYHLLGGVEFRRNWVATAFEVQYSRVPDALGAGGASAAFAESNLGGFGSRVRILIGR
jgi:hypothetical protein